MVLIPAGDFQMGTPPGSIVPYNERPEHKVTLSAYLIGNCEVTKSEWDLVRDWGKTHGFADLPDGSGTALDHPVCEVTWFDALRWCNARSLKEGFKPCYTVAGQIYQKGAGNFVDCDWTANGYRLPTEAEWEKAARGGLVGKAYPWGDVVDQSHANYCDLETPSGISVWWNGMLDKFHPRRAMIRSSSSLKGLRYHPAFETDQKPYTSPIASFAPNGYGLYDMAGNVSEWCWDWYDQYSSLPQKDPRGVAYIRSGRITRGGDWDRFDYNMRCAYRCNMTTPEDANFHTGFRVARSSVP